jgi:hypothetical protein
MKKQQRIGLWLVSMVILLSLGWISSARAVTIASPGTPAPVIVTPANPSAVLAPAITDLQHYLEQMTGQKIEVVQTASPGRMAIRVGMDDMQLRQDIEQRHWGDQAFVLDIDDHQVRIFAESDFGTRYGVYALLEHMGVRWLFPGEWGEVVPPMGPINLPAGRTVDHPTFTIREMDQFAHGAPTQYGDWARRQREASSGFGGHSSLMLDYRKAHPEWFALVGGKRQNEAKEPKLCHSNPAMVRQAVEDTLAGIARIKQSTGLIDSQCPIAPASTGYVYSISPTDGGGFCQCDACKKMGSVSDRLQIFANTIAAAVAKKYPGEYVAYYGAYSEAESPPTVKAAPNVMVFATTWTKDFFQTLDTMKNGPFREKLKAWSRMCPNMALRDFDGLPVWWGYGPLSLIDVHAADYKWYAAHSIRGFLTEAQDHWAGFGESYYVTLKLMWNPNADVHAIEQDFVQKGFGAAYKPMWRYYQCINAARGFVPSDTLLAMRHDLEEAASLAKRPDVKHRIDCLRLYHLMLATMTDAQMGQASDAQLLTAARVGQSIAGKNIVSKGMVNAIVKLYQKRASSPAKDVPPYTQAELAQVLATMKLPATPTLLSAWPTGNDLRLTPLDEKPAKFKPDMGVYFRYGPNTVLIDARPDEKISVTPTTAKASVRYELFGPEQAVVASGVFSAAHPLSYIATSGGIYNLQATMGITRLDVSNRYAVIKAASPSEKLHPINSCAFYFQVPRGTKEFAIAMRSDPGESYVLTVWGPRDAKKPILQTPLSNNTDFYAWRIKVPSGADGTIWRLHLSGEDKEIFLRGVPPLLASDPARLLGLEK